MGSRRLVLALAAAALLVATPARGAVVDDVTRLNPILVDDILEPTSIEQIVEAVRAHPGPVSIGGGRFSQGGQTATEHALLIDMRRFDQVVAFSAERQEVTVQAGITWRRLQEFLDPRGLAVRIMQSYANFTVGGSLSVNVHGRYRGEGPLVLSVRSIRVVLADGTLVDADPATNPDIFHGAIGGYGGLGVIVEATLSLTENVRVERRSVVMPMRDYGGWFQRNVRDDREIVFHNADLYPDGFDTVRATSFVRTERPVTVEERLVPPDRSYWAERVAMRIIADWPGGKFLRRAVVDPILFAGDRVEWRNYEASYDVRELEPVSRRFSTYVLQEYFVPVDRLDQFVEALREVLSRHDVNAINVSIRHAREDPGTLLAWARGEVFAFVLYYKQGTAAAEREAVGVWTRELIDAALRLGGSYFLPYQLHATPEQFRAAYPRSQDFFALKRRVDPTGKFRNKLWDKYGAPASSDPRPLSPPAPEPIAVGVATQEERLAADVAREYAAFRAAGPWYRFPWLRSLKQLWAETDLFGPRLLRKWERKAALSAGYLVRAQAGLVVDLACRAAPCGEAPRKSPAAMTTD